MKKKTNLLLLIRIVTVLAIAGLIVSILFILHNIIGADNVLLALKHSNMWWYLLVCCIVLITILTQYKRFIKGKKG